MSKPSFAGRLSRKVTLYIAIIFILNLVIVDLTTNNIIAEQAAVSTQHMLHGTIGELELPLGEVEIAARTEAALVASIADTGRVRMIMRRIVASDTLICGGAVIYPTDHGARVTMCYKDSTGEIILFPVTGGWDEGSWVNRCLAAVDHYKAPFWAEPYQAEGNRNKRVTSYCYPVYREVDGDSVLHAVVTAELSVEWMEQKCASLRPYPNALTTIMCGSSFIGLHDSALIANIQTTVAEDKGLQDLQRMMMRGEDSMRRIGSGSKAGFIVYGPMRNGWVVSIVCHYKDVLHQSSLVHINLMVIGVVALILLYIVCRRTIKRMTTPITQLSDAALRMAKGDLSTQLPEIKSADEMKHLHDSFVYMQNSITEYIDELKTTTAANERMESELVVARNIQMGMLRSDFPANMAAILVPAKEVGGDLYDFVVKDNYLYFSIGDVSGKGVPASLMMAITRAGLRFVVGMDQPMDKLMERINASVTDSNSNNMFVTLFVGRINLETRHMEYCNAGHNPIIVIPPDQEPYFLKAKANLAIGLFEDFEYEAESLDLSVGTRLVLYTDGVNEAERMECEPAEQTGASTDDKSLFGNERLLEWAASAIVRNQDSTEADVVDDLYSKVRQFTEGNEQNDDITIMSIHLI